MTTYGLGPTRLHTPAQRLLRGKGVASAAGAGTAEEWVRLDRAVHVGTSLESGPWKYEGRERVGFRTVGQREIADWSRAPYWQDGPGGGAPSWSSPPTSSEIALCLSHVDPRVREAALALALAGAEALPDSLLPLVLIRTADTHQRVRDLARTLAHQALGAVDSTVSRHLVALAVLVGRRQHGAWVRETVLSRVGGLPDEVLNQLLTSRGRETRMAGLDVGATHGRLDLTRAWSAAGNDRDESVRIHAARTAIRLALAAGRQTDLDETRARFLTRLDAERSHDVRLALLAVAVEADLLVAQDLAHLAVAHGYRKIRRHACDAVLAHPEADTVLDQLLSARDTYVRRAAVERLTGAGRGDELHRYLTDPSGGVRATACRALRALRARCASVEDPRTHYLSLCSDPATVSPAAVIGLAEQGHPDDAAVLHPLTRHPDAAVRARALSALRLLQAIPDEALPPFADDPDPSVRATALTGMRDSAPLLRGQLHNPREGVRARVLDLLERHRLHRADSCRCCATPTRARRSTGQAATWSPEPAAPRPTATRRLDVTPFSSFPSPDRGARR
jgi:hypothetical protein